MVRVELIDPVFDVEAMLDSHPPKSRECGISSQHRPSDAFRANISFTVEYLSPTVQNHQKKLAITGIDGKAISSI